ncbi:MAG: YfbM family protein [Novosphingobium sp.]
MGMVWVARLASDEQVRKILAKPDDAYDFITSEGAEKDGSVLDLDKQWHAVHFLLTGSAGPTSSPLSLILGNFQSVGTDCGYGPAWLAPKLFIKAFDHALSALSGADLKARYDAAAMAREQVYLADTLLQEGEAARDFILHDIDRMRKFFAEAALHSLNAFAVIT